MEDSNDINALSSKKLQYVHGSFLKLDDKKSKLMDLSVKYIQSPQQYITGETTTRLKNNLGVVNNVERWKRPSKD